MDFRIIWAENITLRLGVHLWEADFVDFTSEGDREVVDSSWVDSVIVTATSVIVTTVSLVSGTKTGPKNKNKENVQYVR